MVRYPRALARKNEGFILQRCSETETRTRSVLDLLLESQGSNLEIVEPSGSDRSWSLLLLQLFNSRAKTRHLAKKQQPLKRIDKVLYM